MPRNHPLKKARKGSTIHLKLTSDQSAIIKRAADICHKPIDEFVLQSACTAAKGTPSDQSTLYVADNQFQSLMELIKRPARYNHGLKDLFSKSPW